MPGMNISTVSLQRLLPGALFVNCSEVVATSVAADNRRVTPGDVFVAVQGTQSDGHDHAAAAVAMGATSIVVERALPELNIPQCVVPCSATSFAKIATALQVGLPVPLCTAGITGTNGKSTTKEMVASISSTRYTTLKGLGNLNNHIGLPLNLLKLTAEHEVAILEMGMSARGEIARLAEIAEPEIGLITNVSEAHMVHLPTVQDVQAAKGELFESLSETDCAVVNADDPLVLELAQKLRSKKITFGIENDADVRGLDVQPGSGFGTRFSLKASGETHPVELPFPGRYNVLNAVAAAATGVALGLRPEDIVKGLETSELLGQRVQVRTVNGMTLLDDTYNANPRSMAEAVNTLSNLDTAGRRFLVIGDMFELGQNEAAAHRLLGEQVAESPIDFLVGVGDLISLTAEAAIAKGLAKKQCAVFKSHNEAAGFLKDHTQSGDAILFKGSRGAQMERVLNAFAGDN